MAGAVVRGGLSWLRQRLPAALAARIGSRTPPGRERAAWGLPRASAQGGFPLPACPGRGASPRASRKAGGGGSHAPRPSGAGHRLAEKSPRFVSVSWETRVRRRVRGELHLGEVAASRLLQLGENIKSLSSASESPGKFCSKGGKTPSR